MDMTHKIGFLCAGRTYNHLILHIFCKKKLIKISEKHQILLALGARESLLGLVFEAIKLFFFNKEESSVGHCFDFCVFCVPTMLQYY